MATKIHMRRQAHGDLREVVETIQKSKELTGGHFVCSEIIRDEATALMTPNSKAALLCYEQYYVSVKSIVLLTVMLLQEDTEQRAVIVGSGAGVMFTDPGRALANRTKKVLSDMGFEIYSGYKRPDEDEKQEEETHE